jgi:hypothetical protein
MAESPDSDKVIRPSRFAPAAGGSGPSDPSVEARLARVEAGIDQIRLDLAEIKGKLSNMPTTVTLFALVLTIFAAAFGLLKLSSTH